MTNFVSNQVFQELIIHTQNICPAQTRTVDTTLWNSFQSKLSERGFYLNAQELKPFVCPWCLLGIQANQKFTDTTNQVINGRPRDDGYEEPY